MFKMIFTKDGVYSEDFLMESLLKKFFFKKKIEHKKSIWDILDYEFIEEGNKFSPKSNFGKLPKLCDAIIKHFGLEEKLKYLFDKNEEEMLDELEKLNNKYEKLILVEVNKIAKKYNGFNILEDVIENDKGTTIIILSNDKNQKMEMEYPSLKPLKENYFNFSFLI